VSFVLAALDNSASARAVLDAAVRIGRLTGTPVRAVYVRTDPLEPFDAVESAATRAQVPLRVVEGPLEPTLIDALGDPEVIVAAIGAWSGAPPTGPYPTGHTARALLEHADKPVVVVPPATGSRGVIRRILLPLEGTEGSSRPVLERLLPLLVDQVELVVLHVFTDATVPAMLDRPCWTGPSTTWTSWGGSFSAGTFPMRTVSSSGRAPSSNRLPGWRPTSTWT